MLPFRQITDCPISQQNSANTVVDVENEYDWEGSSGESDLDSPKEDPDWVESTVTPDTPIVPHRKKSREPRHFKVREKIALNIDEEKLYSFIVIFYNMPRAEYEYVRVLPSDY